MMLMSERSDSSVPELWEVRVAPGCGRGLFATRDLDVGEVILHEVPLVRGPCAPVSPTAWVLLSVLLGYGGHWFDSESHWALKVLIACLVGRVFTYCLDFAIVIGKVILLEQSRKRQFYTFDSGLPTYLPGLSEYRIFLRNSVSDEGNGCVCAGASMINHSCCPNAVFSWTESCAQHEVRALRKISKGEQIAASYIGLWIPFSQRKRELKRSLGFTCLCAACSHDTGEREASDRRRIRAAQLESSVQSKLDSGDSATAVLELQSLCNIVQEELHSSDNLIISEIRAAILDLKADIASRKTPSKRKR